METRKYGWTVGEKLFTNKWQAISYATKNPKLTYHAYCNDHTWDQANWTQEPKESITDLEIQHCEYLRKKYKTLVLFYSGGVDSHTVLENFLENKIPLDYICVCYVKEPQLTFNKDTQLAIEYLRQNESRLMGAKILYTSKLNHNEGNSIFNYKGDITQINFQLRFHHAGHRHVLKNRYPDVYEQIIKNGCIITGVNKPYVYYDSENGYHMYHVDYDDENWGQPYLEMFWQGVDPKLQIKQCHLAKKWLIENKHNSTNTIYKSNDDVLFWDLNKSFGRKSMNDYFHKKYCFGETVHDQYFSQGYGSNWHNKYYADYMSSFQNTKAYVDLTKKLTQLEKDDDRFISNYKLLGWITTKRYLG